ncbi:hypothetical protein AYO43_10580 [Nitrospira sp. SCGC AG-212-E16]|nr:hypothetical protein AYO43_10580 [Nitrospira sp. SCGC AG-212-E16]
MATLPRIILALAVSTFLTGCVGTRTEYFTDTTYPPRRTAAPVEWLTAEPARAHLEVARITLRSSNYSMDTLQNTMLERARALGADAIVPDVPMAVKALPGRPYYEPGLLGPAGVAFGLYGYGWYTPYSSNPYILTQGATDQLRIEHVLSGIAIRFKDTTQ